MKTCTYALSDEQVALLPAEEDVALRGARVVHLKKGRELPVNGGYSDWKPGDGDTIRNNEYTALQSKQLRKLALQPVIGAASMTTSARSS